MTQENTANIKPDLNITEIASVYYHRNSDWKRTEFVPRGKDGLVLFLEGEIDYNFGEKHYTAKAGDILCFPGNIPSITILPSDNFITIPEVSNSYTSVPSEPNLLRIAVFKDSLTLL